MSSGRGSHWHTSQHGWMVLVMCISIHMCKSLIALMEHDVRTRLGGKEAETQESEFIKIKAATAGQKL